MHIRYMVHVVIFRKKSGVPVQTAKQGRKKNSIAYYSMFSVQCIMYIVITWITYHDYKDSGSSNIQHPNSLKLLWMRKRQRERERGREKSAGKGSYLSRKEEERRSKTTQIPFLNTLAYFSLFLSQLNSIPLSSAQLKWSLEPNPTKAHQTKPCKKNRR